MSSNENRCLLNNETSGTTRHPIKVVYCITTATSSFTPPPHALHSVCASMSLHAHDARVRFIMQRWSAGANTRN